MTHLKDCTARLRCRAAKCYAVPGNSSPGVHVGRITHHMPKSHAKYSKLKISFICVIPCEVDCTRTLGYKKDGAQSRKNSFFCGEPWWSKKTYQSYRWNTMHGKLPCKNLDFPVIAYTGAQSLFLFVCRSWAVYITTWSIGWKFFVWSIFAILISQAR